MRMIVAYISDAKTVSSPISHAVPSVEHSENRRGFYVQTLHRPLAGGLASAGETAQARRRGEVRIGSGGPGFAGGLPLPLIDQSDWDWHGCCHGAVRGIFCNATNHELSKALAQTSLPARHQYGLQIAEGVVTFFESYEQSG